MQLAVLHTTPVQALPETPHISASQIRTPTAPEELAQLAIVAEAERVNYERLKAELRTAASALSLACFAACYYFYGRVRRRALSLLSSRVRSHMGQWRRFDSVAN